MTDLTWLYLLSAVAGWSVAIFQAWFHSSNKIKHIIARQQMKITWQSSVIQKYIDKHGPLVNEREGENA